METKKLLLIIIFSTSLLFLWDSWQREINPSTTQVTPGNVAESNNQRHDPLPVPGDGLTSKPDSPSVASGIEGVDSTVTPNLFTNGEKITVTTDMIVAEIDTAGGDIRQLGLLKHPSSEDKSKPYELLLDKTARFHVAQSGLIGDGLPSHKTKYSAKSNNYQLEPDQEKLVIKLTATTENNIQVTKIFTFHRNSYVIDVAFEIDNQSDETIIPFSYFQMLRDANEPTGSNTMIHSYTGPAMYTEAEKFIKIKFTDLDKNKAEFPANADNGWIAMLEHYFLTAWLPTQQTPREYYAKRLSHNQYTAGIITPVGTIESGQTKQISVPFYAGPQEQEKLAQLSPGLDLTVDYGWLTILAQPLFKLLSFYHSWVDNWGVSIILLTLTVKLLFFPLSAAGYRSMAKLRVVTPKLQKIREQYASDRQRMHQAMMEFYKEEKINPMGGCLPILVQIPVFIALFWTLMSAVELRNTPFALWITDLSTPDPYYVLPLIMGISMWIQSKLSPTPADPIQAKVMQIMPIAFSVFFFFFPSGLVLYSLCNNILSILQQWQITRMYENKAEDASKDKNKKHKKIESAPVVEKLALNPSVPAEERVEEGATTSATITEGQSESISSTEAIAPKPKPKTSSLSNKNKPPQGKKVRKK
ncbi:MAG TPA: membrane protein insertase YidC [Nitrosomonas sp.]|nr:membrane protein insertase YidC [Nitrosomonas sp.]HQX14488.1 membrane protein insertase YidC [Nitrosomonas sp.]HRB33373.1 membrane protein insertase YidC [Nitrosomonas sp.]HRB46664.1 membrane protein insertase YidC [Nitrosomonas sp.]